MYIKEAGGGEESVPELGVVIRGDSHLHIDRIWSTYNRVPGSPPSNSLQRTLAHNHTWKENNRKCLCSLLNFLPPELVRRGYGHFSRTSPLATHEG